MVNNHFMPLGLENMINRSRVSTLGSNQSGEWLPTLDDLRNLGIKVQQRGEGASLNFQDFLQLMVQQLQNQTIDSTTDSSEMLNQLVQMTTVEMLSTVKEGLQVLVDATTLNYASSLVGKTVTVGKLDKDGTMKEIEGTVTGTGTYQGSVVIFVDGEMYPLSDIMAIGKLPAKPEKPESGGGAEGGGTGGTGGTEGQEKPPAEENPPKAEG